MNEYKITETVPSIGIPTTTVFFFNANQPIDKKDISFLNRCGRNWRLVVIKNKIGPLARVHHSDNIVGNFYTLIWSWKDEDEAKQYLELPENTKIDFKTKFEINPGCKVVYGQFLKTNYNQFYIKDIQYVIQIGETEII